MIFTAAGFNGFRACCPELRRAPAKRKSRIMLVFAGIKFML
jgi:hypothetical protein